MRVVIVGAGIGGSALALALHRSGVDYVLLEQAAELTTVGAGIQLSPNGVRILEWLGLKEDLKRFCVEPSAHLFKEWDTGENVLTTPLSPKVRETFGAAYYHAHRADLIGALSRRLAAENLKLNSEVVGVGQDAVGAWAELANGTKERGDVLIGADGIHSLVRSTVFKPGPPRASGFVAWRGVVSAEDAAPLGISRSSFIVMGPRLSSVFYYISGGTQINWINIGLAADTKRESWSQTARKSEVLKSFDGWYDAPVGLVECTEQPFVTALYDRDPLPKWVDGRIALMGDAAHAMLPYHAQGAVQSIEDAWLLARSIELGQNEIENALQRYESLRKPRADSLIQHSRSAERWYHVDDPAEVEARNNRFRSIDKKYAGDFVPQQVWLYSYDAEKAVLGTDDEWRELPAW